MTELPTPLPTIERRVTLTADDQAHAVAASLRLAFPAKVEVAKWVVAGGLAVAGAILLIAGENLGLGVLAFAVLLAALFINARVTTTRQITSTTAATWPVGSELTLRATPSDLTFGSVLGTRTEPLSLVLGVESSGPLLMFRRSSPHPPVLAPARILSEPELDAIRTWISRPTAG